MKQKRVKPTLLGAINVKLYSNENIAFSFTDINGDIKSGKIKLLKFVKRLKAIAKEIPEKDKDLRKWLEGLGIEYLNGLN